MVAIRIKIWKQEGIPLHHPACRRQIRVETGGLRVYLGSAEWTGSPIALVGRRLRQRLVAGIFFVYATEGDPARTSGNRMGSNLDRLFNPLTGRLDEGGRNPAAFEVEAWIFHRRLTSLSSRYGELTPSHFFASG
jgi:hypothetical protein